MDLLTVIHLIVRFQGSVVATTNMNIIIKSIILILLGLALSMVISLLVVVAYQYPPPEHKSLLTDYSKLDITTQLADDLTFIQEN